ncbi:MAG: 3-phosphoshikimate 1-carboxyvinyltransferase [Eubacteriales bacterium]
MKVRIEKSKAYGNVAAPPSKSYAHRLIICAAIAGGGSEVLGISDSEDILATLDCAASCLNAEWKRDGNDLLFSGSDVYSSPSSALKCRESGSTMRFFIPLCLVKNTECLLYGSEKLLSRPLSVYEDICKAQGLLFSHEKDHIRVRGPLSSGKFTVPGNISSQFISGLMFALPLLHGDSEINIIPPIDSKPYIDITMVSLSKFGVDVRWKDEHTLFIKGDQTYIPAREKVEGDHSNAAFLSALSHLGGNVTVTGLISDSAQGDKVYAGFFDELEKGSPVIDISDCPDLAPILMSMAAAKHGVTLTGTSRLKIKESDRGEVMAAELKKFGVPVTVAENSIKVEGGKLRAPDCELYGHNDHRIVMSLSVLATLTGGTIDGAQAVRKSYPDFFGVIKKLGIEVYEIGD